MIPPFAPQRTPFENAFNHHLRATVNTGVDVLFAQWESLRDTSLLSKYELGNDDLVVWVHACTLLTNYTLGGFLDAGDQEQVDMLTHHHFKPGGVRRAEILAQLGPN